MNTSTFADALVAIGQSPALGIAVKATVMLALGLGAAAAMRRAPAAIRHLVLAATVAGVLTLPLAALLAPVVAIELAGSARPVVSRPGASRVTPAGDVSIAALDRVQPAVAAAAPRVALGDALVAVWILGALLSMASLAVAVHRLGRFRRNGVPWLEAPPFVRALCAELGTRRPIQILLHEGVCAPLTCGLRRPAIVLPIDAGEWPDAETERALVHELEHVRRFDWPVQLAARLACAVYWFHPLGWMALRQLRFDAERACDDAVVRTADGAEYAAQLVALARRIKDTPDAGGSPVLAMAARSDLSRRIAALLDAARTRDRAGARAIVTSAAVAAVVVIGMAPLRAVAASPGAQAASARNTSADDRPLYRAASRGDLQRMSALIKAGANVNAVFDGDGSPLIAAARAGHYDATAMLLGLGADPNLAVPGDGNPIIMAARAGHAAIVELLLTGGAQIDMVVDGDENALIQASWQGHLPVVELLVAKGANVNARVWAEPAFERPRGEWRTPLSMARREGHQAVVDFLRLAGARD